MKRGWPILLYFLLACPQLAADEKLADQWIAVTAPAYRKAIEPLCQHHKAQGMQVVVLQTSDVLSKQEILAGDAGKLRERVNKLCRDAKGKSYVLLVGAFEPAQLAEPENKVLPALKGTASRMKGEPSDNGFGCPGEGLLPTVAVGRFPARSEEEAQQMVQKTLAFEKDAQPGDWRRRITILAGAPQFNPTVDALVERLALGRLGQIDPSWSGQAIFHNPQSRFCLPDEEIHDRALAYVQRGQAITLHLGHANEAGFWAGKSPYLDREDWAKLAIPRGGGLFATFGCKGCQLTGKTGEGYGLAAFRNPRGPVAVVGSHGVCFAAIVQLAADGLYDSYLAGSPPERLGECWLKIKQNVAKEPMNPIVFKLLDAVDGDSNIPEATQRLEHLEMFLLLGDPALRLPAITSKIEIEVAGEVAPGKTLTITGKAPAALEAGRVKLMLERPLTSDPADLQPLPEKPGADREQVMRANHDRANRFVLQTKETVVKDGKFEVQLELPAKLPWPKLILRAYAANDRQEAMGVLVVKKALAKE